jgi:hypothetical protein
MLQQGETTSDESLPFCRWGPCVCQRGTLLARARRETGVQIVRYCTICLIQLATCCIAKHVCPLLGCRQAGQCVSRVGDRTTSVHVGEQFGPGCMSSRMDHYTWITEAQSSAHSLQCGIHLFLGFLPAFTAPVLPASGNTLLSDVFAAALAP